VGLTTLPPSCADCLEIREPQAAGTRRACNGIASMPLYVGAEVVQCMFNCIFLKQRYDIFHFRVDLQRTHQHYLVRQVKLK
jgi:hypothetical protein